MKSVFQTIDDLPARTGLRAENPIMVIWGQKTLFAVVFAVVFLSAVAALLLLPHRYFTAGSMIVAEPESGLALPPAGWAQKVGDPADIESQLLVIRSARVMRLVLDKPGMLDTIRKECDRARNPVLALFSSFDCTDLRPDSPAAIDYMQSRYTVGGAGRSRVISIGYTSRQPETARDMANALITTFLQAHRDGIADGRAVAVSGIGEEIDRLDREIRSDDAKIQSFRAMKGLTSGAQAPITSERLSSINTQLAQAESSRSQAASIIAAARDGGTGAASMLPAVVENRAVADVKQRLAGAREELAAANIALGPRHPRLRAMQSQIAALQASLDREVGNVVGSAQKQFEAAERTVVSLKRDLDAAKVDAASASQDETSIEQMVRDLGVKRSQYGMLFDQRKKLESEQKALLGSTRLVSLAELPDTKFFPKTAPFLGGGFAAGLIAAAAAALFWGRMRAGHAGENDPADRDPPQIIARLPAIGSRRERLGMLQKLVEADASRGMKSAMKALLASLDDARSVVVLSAFAAEGKTFTTLALARFAAHAGKRVLVVEAGMRQPKLAGLFAIEPAATLVDVLTGQTTPRQAVIRTDVDGLDLIAAGHSGSVCPTQYLMSEQLVDFLAWTAAYDLVLIDGPALDRQMDAGLLACRTDGFLFCINGNEEELAEMAEITRRLTNLGAHSLGFVMTPAVAEAEDSHEADPQPVSAGGH